MCVCVCEELHRRVLYFVFEKENLLSPYAFCQFLPSFDVLSAYVLHSSEIMTLWWSADILLLLMTATFVVFVSLSLLPLSELPVLLCLCRDKIEYVLLDSFWVSIRQNIGNLESISAHLSNAGYTCKSSRDKKRSILYTDSCIRVGLVCGYDLLTTQYVYCGCRWPRQSSTDTYSVA